MPRALLAGSWDAEVIDELKRFDAITVDKWRSSRAATAEEVAEAIRRVGGSADGIRADASDTESIDDLISATVARHGSLDVAFNNAARPGPYLTLDEWRRAMDLNPTGTLARMNREVQAMWEYGGVILSTASMAALNTAGRQPDHQSSKARSLSLARHAAGQYAGRRIRVNAVTWLASDETEFLTGVELMLTAAHPRWSASSDT